MTDQKPNCKQKFNRNNFITLNSSRLFTAKEVSNYIREYEGDAEKEKKRLLDKLSARLNDISETAEMTCQDGYHTGEHSTEVIRVSYLERELESLRGKP